MFKSQDSYSKLAEKISSLKEINKPSDDPIGMNKVLNLRKSKASIEQYTQNMDGCESWLTITESKLSAAGDLLVNARVVAIAQSTATSSAEDRSSEAETVQQLIDQMLALANSKYDGRYLFSGTKTEEAPFSSTKRTTPTVTVPEVQPDGNGFGGTVVVSSDPADYSGTENKTYVVKIVTGGELGAATYQVSSDGGKTWLGEDPVNPGKIGGPDDPPFDNLDGGGPINLGDGVELTFDNGTDADHRLAADDIFYVQALAVAAPTVTVEAPSVNTFDGTVASGGVYSGTENKTYVVKITGWKDDGTTKTATYNVSDDGGASWKPIEKTFELPNGGSVDTVAGDIDGDIVNGIFLTFKDTGVADPELAVGDIFNVQALAAEGYYNGNGEEMSVNIDEKTPFAYSISGEAAFTDKGEGTVDIFGVLNELKTALENNDPDTISSCIDDLKAGADQISKNISSCGSRINRLEIAKSNLVDLDLNLTQLLSDTEDADMAEVITRFAMKETVLKASYATASKIGNLTILDFLR